MALHIVRHAKAGSRADWAQPDELRPLTPAGRQQAAGLVAELVEHPIKRVLTSRFARCCQTVEPLALELGLDVEQHPALAEEADLDDTWALLEELAGTEAVLCTHGNVIPPVVDRALRRGATLAGEHGNKKASVWTFELDPDGRITTARYTPPPL